MSGTKKEPKPKLFGPDIFQWGRGLPCERVGAKKFDTSLETREIKLFGRDIPGFCRDILGVPEKFEKKNCIQFPFPRLGSLSVTPYCATPRDYLTDTPLLRAMGFLVSQHGRLGAIPPPPFLSVSPLDSMRSGGAIPLLKRGISAILARYPMKTRQTGAVPPSAILSRKGIARYVSNLGSTPTSWAPGLRDQIQKWALQAQKTLYF